MGRNGDNMTSAASLHERNTEIGGASSLDMPVNIGGRKRSQLSPINVKDFQGTPGKRNHPQLNASQINGVRGGVPKSNPSLQGDRAYGG